MRDRPFLEWDWVLDHLAEIRAATLEHLRLTVIAVVLGVVLAAALSAVALRWRRTLAPIAWVTGVIYTIPSLALFTFLVPIFGLGSTVAAEIALVGYTLLILIRNIVAGVDGVDPAVRDAADGMGYGRWHRLVAVELPLAVPAIIAGIRIAAVTTVGLVTVTGLIGLGGYGSFIDAGLKRQFPTQIVLGGGLSVIMATVIDVALVGLERLLTPWRRSPTQPLAEPEPLAGVLG
ncbi:MAG TPA: ABC transporter permease [Acidimicrobiales bacterium]|jgi:osmoprotectant transport system permease protein|nr:ABC transporter permease [Acidimicrobiales bacterium]